MRIIIQRVKYAKCIIDEVIHSEIQDGFMILVGIKEGDEKADIEKVAKKVAKMRIFTDENDKMNLDLDSINGKILSISQFTLYADCAKGNRPSFSLAMKPPMASDLYDYFNDCLRGYGIEVQTGIFGADMKIEMINDGPVTIFIDSEDLKR